MRLRTVPDFSANSTARSTACSSWCGTSARNSAISRSPPDKAAGRTPYERPRILHVLVNLALPPNSGRIANARVDEELPDMARKRALTMRSLARPAFIGGSLHVAADATGQGTPPKTAEGWLWASKSIS